jgi:VanZ family protein
VSLGFERRPTARRALKAAWVAMIVFVVWSSLIPDDSALKKAADEFSDFALHFCAYLGLSLLGVVVQKTRRKSILAAVAMGVLGLVLEGLQGLTATRSMDIADAVANWTGVACGMLLGLVLV